MTSFQFAGGLLLFLVGMISEYVTEILAKILGMLVAAIAVRIIADVVIGFLQNYGTLYSFSLDVK